MRTVDFRGREDKLALAGGILQNYLRGSMLDVGCDQKHLAKIVTGRYVGVDSSGKPDLVVNVENGLPFKNKSFDTVVAFDILEHVDNIHYVFDELCRVARRFVVIGVPNMYEWRFRLMFLLGKPLSGKYGLPIDLPRDRHRWLFSLQDARSFFKERGFRQGFKIREELVGYYRYTRLFGRAVTAIGKTLSRFTNRFTNLFAYHYWAILERCEEGLG